MASLNRFIRLLRRYISKRFWLFFAVFLLSIHQATILAYGHFGWEAILANLEQLNDIQVPNSFVLSYLGQLGLGKVVFKIANYAIMLFVIQCIPAFIYGRFSSLKSKRRAALIIWLLPAVLGLPTLVITLMYLLMSPVFAIFTFPGFMFVPDTAGQFFNKEDFAEGVTFVLSVVGWFYLFWLAVTVKVWVFPNYQFNRTRRSHVSNYK